MWVEDVQEQGAEEDIWAKIVFGGNCIMRSFMMCNPHQILFW